MTMRGIGPEELGRLVDAHGAALVLYARQWCAAPEDVVQEAFVKLTALATAPANPAAWLYAVVRNAALSTSRAERRRQRRESACAARKTEWFEPGNEGELDPELAARALETLPPAEREVIVAHLWGGLTFEEIGDLLGSSASTAHRHYAAGLVRLRERLGATCLPRRTIRS
jgi:RNA polymerase sigma-70 factor (ECF subfamily)